MSRRGRIASDRLTQALITMAAKGLRPNCSDPGSHWMWLSEHPQERALAALMCGGCPVIAECDAAAEANDERHGVAGRGRPLGQTRAGQTVEANRRRRWRPILLSGLNWPTRWPFHAYAAIGKAMMTFPGQKQTPGEPSPALPGRTDLKGVLATG
jgi:hypothetical protein